MDTNIAIGTFAPGGLDMDEMDIMLANLDVQEADEAELLETIEAEAEEEIVEPIEEAPALGASEMDIQELELEVSRAETYDEQEAPASDVTVEAITDAPAAAAKPAKAPRAPKASSPKITVNRDLGTLAAEAFVLSRDNVPADLDANKASVLASRPSQKKIAEKFDNVITSLFAGKLPSTFVVDAFSVLVAKKTVTSTELVAAFQADGYNEGTARSQVGQVMNLFGVLGFASRSGSSLTLNNDSALGLKLGELIAARP